MINPKNLIDFTCERCNKTVKIEKWRLKDTRKYCNRECYLEVVAEQKRVREAKKEKKKKIIVQKIKPQKKKERKSYTKNCLFCKLEYETYNRYQKFCGTDCSSASYHSRGKAKKIAKTIPVLESEPKIPVWQTKIYIDKKEFKEFQFQGTVQGIIKQIIQQIKTPKNCKRMDIHIRFIGDSKID